MSLLHVEKFEIYCFIKVGRDVPAQPKLLALNCFLGVVVASMRSCSDPGISPCLVAVGLPAGGEASSIDFGIHSIGTAKLMRHRQLEHLFPINGTSCNHGPYWLHVR